MPGYGVMILPFLIIYFVSPRNIFFTFNDMRYASLFLGENQFV